MRKEVKRRGVMTRRYKRLSFSDGSSCETVEVNEREEPLGEESGEGFLERDGGEGRGRSKKGSRVR